MTVVFETERLFVRELLLNDVEPLAAILAKANVTEHIGGPRDSSGARAWIQQQQRSYREFGYGYWAVIHRESAALVGQAGVECHAPPRIGCVLDEPYWRLGLAKEVLTAVRAHAFEELQLDQLGAVVHPNNAAGQKLAVALGMDLEHQDDEAVYRLVKEST